MPVSQAQVRLAHDVLEGRSNRMPVAVAREIVAQTPGHALDALPKRAPTKAASIRIGGHVARDPRSLADAVRRRG
jgi:hypothetical protein